MNTPAAAMIDLVAIFDKRGILLFQHNPLGMKTPQVITILNELISKVFRENSAEPIVTLSSYRLAEFTLLEGGRVLTVVYPQELAPYLTFMGDFLANCKVFLEGKASFADNYRVEGFDDDILTSIFQASEAESSHKQTEQTINPSPLSSISSSSGSISSGSKKSSTGRKWGLDKKELKSLDYSKSSHPPTAAQQSIINIKKELEELKASNTNRLESAKPSIFWQAFQSVAGGKELTDESLKAPLQSLHEHLIAKNVASPVASLITQKIRDELRGQKTPAFSTLKSQVEAGAERALHSLIAFETASQFLAQVTAAKSDPYVMAFVGVNGVGKSTSLSKVAAWILENGLSILLVAGDTFRAGAVEQLGKHAQNLQRAYGKEKVAFFEKGYGRDAAQVAEQAISLAKAQNIKVVLIDTAGRMPNNSQLMRALKDLVDRSSPHKILFVGEALAGNESLLQLEHFNAALEPRKVDALMISKYDTVDDKVGAVVNMCQAAKAPVLFVGCGQTFGDLKSLSPSTVVELLLN